MNKRLFVILALLVQWVYSWAYPADRAVKYDFTVDNIFYRINADKKSVAVTYNNRGMDYPFHSLPASYSGEVTIPGSVTYNDVTYPVTKIDMCAFLWCEELMAVSIPNSVTEIDRWAFEGCKGLQNIVLPNNLSSVGEGAFSTSGLTSISIPASLKVLQGFGGCKNLETVTVAEGVVKIDVRCFSGCSSLNSITLPNSLTSIDENAFSNCTSLNTITIPQNVTKIGNQAFYQCSNLNTVHILCELRTVDMTDDGLTFLNVGGSNNGIFQACGDLNVYVTHYYNAAVLLLTNAFNYNGLYQVTSPHFYVNGELVTDFEVPEFMAYVPQASFSHISDMKSIRFHSNLKSIEQYGFCGCTNLEKVEFPDALESLGINSFRDCSSLTEVKFGKGLKEVHSYAFSGCSQINRVDIGDLSNWCAVDFDPDGARFHSSLGAIDVKTSNPLSFAKKIYLNGKQLDRLTIPNGVKSIGLMAFAYCKRFDKLIIPNSVESIGDAAFYQCSDMEEIVFKSSPVIGSIGTAAFSGCNGLTAVTLPDCATELGTGVFSDCVNLESVNLPIGLTTLPNSTFSGCAKLPSITLPQTLKTIGWWAFSGCEALTRIDIPKSLEIIGTEAFKNCYGLTGVYIEDMAAWCGMKFGNDQYQSSVWAPSDKMTNPLIYAHNLYLNNELVTKLMVPEGVEIIEPYTFWGAECIEAVVLPETVKTIKEKAFWYSKVRSVRIPSSVESIEENAFGFLGFQKGESISVLLDNIDQWFRNYGIGFYRSGGNGVKNPNGHVELFVKGKKWEWPEDADVVPMFVIKTLYEKIDNLVIPQSVTALGEYDLSALSLRFVTLHSGVESLYVSTLDNTPLTAIFAQSKFAPTIYTSSSKTGESTSLNSQYTVYKTLTAIYVPKGRTNHYKTKWSDHADIIQETNQDLPGAQSASSIQEMAAACFAVDGNCSFLNLSGATLDETVTGEALQEIADQGTILFLPEGTEGIEGTNIVANGTTPKLILADGADFVTPYDFTATEVVYERSFAASKTEATTLCLPYSVSSLPQGMKAFALQGKDADGNPVFNEVSTLQANMPYLVTTTIPIENLTTENAEIKAIPAETRALAMPNAGDSNFEFVGTLTKLSQGDASDIGAYILSDGMSWEAVDDAGIDILAGRAYLVPKEAGPASYLSVLQVTTPYIYAKGDANGDCKVNVADIVGIVNFIQGHPSDDFNKEAANVNSDLDEQGKPKITISDAEGVVNIIMVKRGRPHN